MNLILVGEIGEYRVLSLLKMFFPAVKFKRTERADGDYIILRVKRSNKLYSLLAFVCIGGVKYRMHSLAAPETEDDALQEQLCSVLYKVLSQALNISLPWGMLTGVRPVKRVRQMIENDHITPRLVPERLEQRFYVSREKSQLCLLTYITQQNMRLKTDYKLYNLYISIPFCPSRCSYCSFVSHAVSTPGSVKLMGEYTNLLCKELEHTSKISNSLGLKLNSIYIGGGTPTTLDLPQLEQLLDAVNRNYNISDVEEFTVEAGRPDTINTDKLKLIKSYGVGRLSVNPQSFDDRVLREIGRDHTAEQAVQSYQQAREAGIDWINMDIIAGLPGDTPDSFQNTVQKVIELAPENITMHTLCVKRASRLHQEGNQHGTYAAQMVDYCNNKVQHSGYMPYYLYRQKNMVDNLENIGYSKPGFESPYNVHIMEEDQTVLAVGAGAVSKLVYNNRLERIFNYKYANEYINGFKEMIYRKERVFNFFESKNKYRRIE